jgi:putative peptidoglycan lipid II flippase
VSRGWRDPEIRALLGRIKAVLAFTGLEALLLLATIVVANRIAGGLVAFQLALNFFYLPAAIITWPVVRALVPRLAAFHQTKRLGAFRKEFSEAVGLVSFASIPIAVAYAVSAPVIADIIAFGRLAEGPGKTYVAVSLLALSPAVITLAWFTIGSYTLYAVQNVTVPLRAMVLRAVTTLLLMIPAVLTDGATSLALIGLAMAGGSLIGAVYVSRKVTKGLPPTDYSVARSLGRTALASVVMLVPAVTAWLALSGLPESKLGDVVRLAVAGAVGAVAFLAVQAWLKAPEIKMLRGGVGRVVPARQEGS